MFNHASENYVCPICLTVQGVENEQTLIVQNDIVYKDKDITAFISSFFKKNNPGHAIIVPNNHYENIYDIPSEHLSKISNLSKEVAIALKETYNCDGTSLAQHNEPAGDQHAFHYHLHVFPRYENDKLYENFLNKIKTTPEERKPYADKLKKYFNT